MSEAAQRTPPGKDAGGTDINLSPCKVGFSAIDITFFQQHESNLASPGLLYYVAMLPSILTTNIARGLQPSVCATTVMLFT
ncbi:MAG TPA: hypothetical protein DEB37_05670 [Lysinibacillus sp.]|nr:hypothetical protein [Lysinibacillus sp.]